MVKRVLLTGAAGFLGHHILDQILTSTDWEVVALVRLDKVGTLKRIHDLDSWQSEGKRVSLVWHDFRSEINDFITHEIGKVSYIIHAGGETHVDRSIANPKPFIESNVLGTLHLLEFARRVEPDWFVFISTDEVFGPAPSDVHYREWDRYNCTNPYSASKAAAEQLLLAYANTYRLPAFIVRSMNLYGLRQHPEKYIPSTIRKVLKGETVIVHADPSCTKPGSRFYLDAAHLARALIWLFERAQKREIYHIVGEREVDNLELAQRIAGILERPLDYQLVDFHSSRPGHDLRYALDGSKMREMGWQLPQTFEKSLEQVVRWTVEHPEWLL